MITEKDLIDPFGRVLCEKIESGNMMHLKSIEANNPKWLSENGWRKVKLPEVPKPIELEVEAPFTSLQDDLVEVEQANHQPEMVADVPQPKAKQGRPKK